MFLRQKPALFLGFILFLFIAKGIIFSILLPFFQGPDEQTHYGTIQYRAEPKVKSWSMREPQKRLSIGSDISTYGFSEETIRSAQATQFDEIKFQDENTQNFSDSSFGPNEEIVTQNSWNRYIDTSPISASGTPSVYYSLAAGLEKLFSDHSVFFRFFLMRLLSVILGALVVLLTYLTARKTGFSAWQSLLASVLVAFQPMFSATAAIVNIDIALILAFSLFIYAAVSLMAEGLGWKYTTLLVFSIGLGILSKGPGVVLAVVAVPLLISLAYKRLNISLKKFFLGAALSIFLLSVITFILVPQSYFISITNISTVSKFDSPLVSLEKYINKTIGGNGPSITHASYWGNFGWLDTKISNTALDIIRVLEILALIGIILYLVSGVTKEKSHLPEKKYVVFFIGIILALQLAIRFYDWRVFDATKQILVGTPGRYFLPNIIPHILLIITGLGFFTRNKKQFHILLKVLALLMILLSLSTMIDVIIPRYYL